MTDDFDRAGDTDPSLLP